MSNPFEKLVGGAQASIFAAHEAGHITVSWLSPAVERVSGTVVRKTGNSCAVQVVQVFREPLTLLSVWEAGAISAAGMAAEVITHQGFETASCRNDLGNMRRDAEYVIEHGGWPCVCPWEEAPLGRPPPFDTYFESPPDVRIVSIMVRFYRRARDVILKHRPAYGRVRLALVAQTERTEEELAAAIRLPKA